MRVTLRATACFIQVEQSDSICWQPKPYCRKKRNFPTCRLVVAVPFNGQDALFSQSAKQRYKRILEEADAAIILSESYYPKCYLRRNDFMLLHSSVLIAYWDGIYVEELHTL